MIIKESDFRKKLDKNIKIERVDMAFNFYLVVEDDGVPCLVAYDYNPVYNNWFPFYDDVNKTPKLIKNTAKTYEELIFECDTILNLDINSKIELAKQRYFEIFGGKNIEVAPINVLYEIKYSKTANVWTIYKLFNYVITKIDEKEKALNPKNMRIKLFNLNKDNFEGLVLNAIEVVKNNKDLLLKNCLK